MRLGIFGGTFDPVHIGHLILAEACREACQLDEIWFVPAASPPHKQTRNVSSAKDRLQMLQFAIAGHSQFKISRMELDRDGPSYTVDTLAELADQDGHRELFLIIGGDSLADFPQWREPGRILELATVVAANRGRQALDISEAAESLGPLARQRLQVVTMPAVDISASELRERVRQGRSIRYQTPRPVELYIQQRGLYQG